MEKSISIQSWAMAIRPKTLTAALVPILVGTFLVYALGGQPHWLLSFFALASSIWIQIGTNLINDAKDFEKGADTEERIGPKRVTQSGLLTQRQVHGAGLLCFLFAVLFALPLVQEGGIPIILLGVFSLLAGYGYTGGPFPLAYVGLGDLFVVIFFGWVAIGGMAFLHTGAWSLPAWVAGTQIGFLATVLIAINNYRDAATDRLVGKNTLAVRFGALFSKFEITLLALVPYFIGFYWMTLGLKWAFFLPWASYPVARYLSQKIWTTPVGPQMNRFLGIAAALHLLFGILLSAGLYLK